MHTQTECVPEAPAIIQFFGMSLQNTLNKEPNSQNKEPKNFNQALILLKNLVFYSKKQLKMVKNGQKRSFLSRLGQNGYLTHNQQPQKYYSHLIEPKNFN